MSSKIKMLSCYHYGLSVTYISNGGVDQEQVQNVASGNTKAPPRASWQGRVSALCFRSSAGKPSVSPVKTWVIPSGTPPSTILNNVPIKAGTCSFPPTLTRSRKESLLFSLWSYLFACCLLHPLKLAQDDAHVGVYEVHHPSFPQTTDFPAEPKTICPMPPNPLQDRALSTVHRTATSVTTSHDFAKGGEMWQEGGTQCQAERSLNVAWMGEDPAMIMCPTRKNIPFCVSSGSHWESKNALVIAIVCRIPVVHSQLTIPMKSLLCWIYPVPFQDT